MSPLHDLCASQAEPGRTRTYELLDTLGKAIVTGYYDRLAFPTEADLARQHAVSRSVTREAVKMLAAKGLLTAWPRIGTVVQPPGQWNLFDPDVLRWLLDRQFSLNLLRQFTELRLAIEPAAAALAAGAASAAQVAEIQAGYDRMADAAGDADPLEADIAFHLAVLRAANNPLFAQLQTTVSTALRSSIHFTNQLEGHAASLAQHHAVLVAISRHEADAARGAVTALLNDVFSLIVGAEGH